MGDAPSSMRGKKIDAKPMFEALHDFAEQTASAPAELQLAEHTLETKIGMQRTADECRLLSENTKYRELADAHAGKIAKLATTYTKVDKKAQDMMDKNREAAKAVGRHIKCMMSAITNGLTEEETTDSMKADLDEIIKSIEQIQQSTGDLGEIAKLMAAEVAVEQEDLRESVKEIQELMEIDKEKEGGREKAFLLCVLAAPMTGGMSLIAGSAFLAGAEVATRDNLQGSRSQDYLVNMHQQLDEVVLSLGMRNEEYLKIVKALKELKTSLNRGAKLQIADVADLEFIANRTTGNIDAITDSYDAICDQTTDTKRLKAIKDDSHQRAKIVTLRDDASTAAPSSASSSGGDSRSTSPGTREVAPGQSSVVIEEVN
jgi:DNA repair exonuclease SbcCD ATPase subunit